MEISSTGSAYTGLEMSLTTPFQSKKIELHAYDETKKPQPIEEGVVFSRSDFYNIDRANQRVAITNGNIVPNQSKTIVQNYINNGMTALEAIHAYKAQLSYGVSSEVNGVGLLSSQNTET